MQTKELIEELTKGVVISLGSSIRSIAASSQLSAVDSMLQGTLSDIDSIIAEFDKEILMGRGEVVELAKAFGKELNRKSLIKPDRQELNKSKLHRWLCSNLNDKFINVKMHGNLNLEELLTSLPTVFTKQRGLSHSTSFTITVPVEDDGASHVVSVSVELGGYVTIQHIVITTTFDDGFTTLNHLIQDVISSDSFFSALEDKLTENGFKLAEPVPFEDIINKVKEIKQKTIDNSTLKEINVGYVDVDKFNFYVDVPDFYDTSVKLKLILTEEKLILSTSTENSKSRTFAETLRDYSKYNNCAQQKLLEALNNIESGIDEQLQEKISAEEAEKEALRLKAIEKEQQYQNAIIDAQEKIEETNLWSLLADYCDALDISLVDNNVSVELDTIILKYICVDENNNLVLPSLVLSVSPFGVGDNDTLIDIDYFEAKQSLVDKVCNDLKAML